MRHQEHHTVFAFAEIMVTAPWAYSLIERARDNDKAWMLQRNTWSDEGLDGQGALALERAARTRRAEHLVTLLRRAAAWLTSVVRRRTPADAGA